MREIRQSGSEGGVAQTAIPTPIGSDSNAFKLS